ncbi:MAG TPA: tautomerase family protein [Burkholderiales bacterium]|nr:tautomerase family protein [Burkholderiales bacterium]
MPLVRISIHKGRPAEFRRKLGDAIHRALVDTIDVPQLDRFQVLTEHESGDLVYDAGYLGIARTNDIVIVQITMSAGRTLAQKRKLFRRIADNLAVLGLRREDACINLVEVAKENWSFGLGEASYAPPDKALA